MRHKSGRIIQVYKKIAVFRQQHCKESHSVTPLLAYPLDGIY